MLLVHDEGFPELVLVVISYVDVTNRRVSIQQTRKRQKHAPTRWREACDFLQPAQRVTVKGHPCHFTSVSQEDCVWVVSLKCIESLLTRIFLKVRHNRRRKVLV